MSLYCLLLYSNLSMWALTSSWSWIVGDCCWKRPFQARGGVSIWRKMKTTTITFMVAVWWSPSVPPVWSRSVSWEETASCEVTSCSLSRRLLILVNLLQIFLKATLWLEVVGLRSLLADRFEVGIYHIHMQMQLFYRFAQLSLILFDSLSEFALNSLFSCNSKVPDLMASPASVICFLTSWSLDFVLQPPPSKKWCDSCA